jgi:hypothetical protein
MYLARRFPACQLWWPSIDEDITVQSLSSRVGKSLLLEMKTTDWNWRRWEHRLTIDVDQLRRYQPSPVPVYYVLPMPPWSEVLNDGHSWLMGRHRSELIDYGHGWFGGWMFVTRAQTIWTWLGWRQKQRSATLFSNSGGQNDPSSIWPEPAPWWTWPDFWDEMSRCGSRDMPAMFTCPSGAVPISDDERPNRRALVESLIARRGELDTERRQAAVERFVPRAEDVYQPLDEGDFLESPLASGAAGRSTALLHLSSADLNL